MSEYALYFVFIVGCGQFSRSRRAGSFPSPCGVMGFLWVLIIPPCRRPIYTVSFYPPALNSSITMSGFFFNTKKSRIDGGEYLADRDSPATFFKDNSDLMITGGRYGTVGRTDTSQSSSSNATRSSTEWHEGYSYPASQIQPTEAYQGAWGGSIMISLDRI